MTPGPHREHALALPVVALCGVGGMGLVVWALVSQALEPAARTAVAAGGGWVWR